MKRTDLIELLKRAAPALSSKDLVPSFSHFFFGEDSVMAYDDVVAIQVPMSSPLKGGLPGKLLMDFLSASRARDVEFSMLDGDDEGVCLVKASRGKLKLPLMPSEDFLFEWPEDKGHALAASAELMTGIKACYSSIGLDPSTPWMMGITLQFEGTSLLMFSSDNFSITEAQATLKKPPKKLKNLVTILPPRFCELLLGRGTPKTLLLTDEWVEAKYEDGTRLFSRTLPDAEPEGYAKVIAGLDWEEHFQKVPKGFDGMLNRSLVVLGGAEEQHADVFVKDGKLRMFTKGMVGEARDYTKFPKHPNGACRARPAMLKRALEHAEKMRLIEGESIAFTAEGIRHLVAVTSE